VILASEDVGLADPHALPLAVAAHHACDFIGLPEAELTLAHATLYIATTPKSNSATLALAAAHGIAVHELVGRSASLEQAYLKLTDHALQYRTTEPLPSLNAVGAESRRGAGRDHR
jgi:replication-associated recombination protein RarA